MKIRQIFDEDFWYTLKKELKDTLKQSLRAILIVLCFSMIFDIGFTPTESMYPTIMVKDITITYKIPKYTKNFKRGEIVTFIPPQFVVDNTREGYKTTRPIIYCKRLIGLPGDTVEIKDGILYVNDKPLEENYLNAPMGWDYEKVIVPKDHCFLLGDNRDISYDSRGWGFLPIKNLRGTLIFRIFPVQRFGKVG